MSLSPSADFVSKAFPHMPNGLISFPRDGEGLICVQGITLQVSPALTSGGGGSF